MHAILNELNKLLNINELLNISYNWVMECWLIFQARIKKIMQMDEEVGKVAATVPVIICILYQVTVRFPETERDM